MKIIYGKQYCFIIVYKINLSFYCVPEVSEECRELFVNLYEDRTISEVVWKCIEV